ncbi:histidine containing phosphotransmitter protein [Aureobasidium pullulans]|uniref:Histidine containing phosphotransmitter protein n=1 Tax=Aureobasidium pullulans TaxID=5580 RepID=A0A4T0B7J1_AURPU|nr:histidine containing phosphotransmitter protein [Aureobasidium pullulans]
MWTPDEKCRGLVNSFKLAEGNPTTAPTGLLRLTWAGTDSTSNSPKKLIHFSSSFLLTLTSEEGSSGLPDFGDTIDVATFEQILEMDDDEEEREFSKSIVFDFFQQADSTFDKMDDYLEKKDLAQLSALGHFLKGSSATLGMTKVKESCEKIQHYGAHKDETGTRDEPDDEVCLKNLKAVIAQAKQEFKVVERQLRKFYHDDE